MWMIGFIRYLSNKHLWIDVTSPIVRCGKLVSHLSHISF